MDLFGDYHDEVERLTDDDIEAILSGDDRSSSPLATLIRDVRQGLLEDPAPEIAAHHLAAMARAAGPAERWAGHAAAGIGTRGASPRRRVAAMALVPALLLVAGLAAAVTLPKKAAEPAPNTVPATSPSVDPAVGDFPQEAAHGQAVSDVARDSTLTGCEKGQAVADAASAKAADNRRGPRERNDPCDRGGNPDKPKPGRRGVTPMGPRKEPKGRDSSHVVGSAGRASAPGLGDEGPGLRGSDAVGGRGRAGAGRGNGSDIRRGPSSKALPTP